MTDHDDQDIVAALVDAYAALGMHATPLPGARVGVVTDRGRMLVVIGDGGAVVWQARTRGAWSPIGIPRRWRAGRAPDELVALVTDWGAERRP